MYKGEGGRWVRVLDEASLRQKERKEKRSYLKNEVSMWLHVYEKATDDAGLICSPVK